MQFYTLSPFFALLLAVCAWGGLSRMVVLLAAMMPFGMFAILGLPSIGGLSLLAVNVVAAALIAGGVLVLASRIARARPVHIDPATVALSLFAVYSVFSATVLVRLFAGETMVFALSRGATGVKVSVFFSWGRVWLGPSSSNISQTLYIVLAAGLFAVLVHVLRARGATFGARCMAVAAAVNLMLGLLDLAALDPLLSAIRTANYSLANSASVSGIPRVIGGHSEASSFGAASAMFFAYFASAWSGTGRPRDGLLALGNGAFTLLALSSTGVIAFALVCWILSIRLVFSAPSRIGRSRLTIVALAVAVAAISLAAVLTMTEIPALIASVVDDLILDKSGSSSGLERRAWAIGGLEAFRDTWGLGAGTGSLRSNGLLFALLGSVGLPGTVAFAAFLWLAFGASAAPGQSGTLADSRLAAFAVLVSMTLTATGPDPGVPLVFLAALAMSTRQYAPVARAIRRSRLPTRPAGAIAGSPPVAAPFGRTVPRR